MKASKKLIITLALVILVACVATGTTLAYLFADAPRLDNKFEPVSVTCEVVESFDGKLKSDVSIKNTGDVDAYIRATLVVTWTAADGTVHSSAPAESVDYSITYGSAKWVKGSDGFYYYTSPVAPAATTELLLAKIAPVDGKGPDGYSLTVHIVATAIQSEPAAAVEYAWNASVDAGGALIPPSN